MPSLHPVELEKMVKTKQAPFLLKVARIVASPNPVYIARLCSSGADKS